MTDLKIDGKLTASGTEALADHAKSLYDRLGTTRMAIVELRAIERTTPAPGEDKAPGVKLRIAGLEVATKDQEDDVRRAQRALHLQRTAQGTIDEHGQIQISQDAIRLLGDVLHDREVARLRATVDYWAREARRVVNHSATLRDGEIRHEMDRVAAGLETALHPARTGEDSDE
jgi:hypothetical protein